jgi:FlaA1/EpsC-like NDP-sugar epimerase
VVLIDGLLVLVLVGGIRFSVRLAARSLREEPNGPTERVAIMGAGDAGAMIAREMKQNPHLGLEPVCFFDDDLGKHDVRIHNIPVLGGRDSILRVAREYRLRRVVIAMPTAPGKEIRQIVKICEEAGVQTQIVPGIYELLDGKVRVNQIRDVDIADLLRREPVQTDIVAVQRLLRGRRVLITGAGGSIGSELCRQIWRCKPSELILLGHGENSIFAIHNELRTEIRQAGSGNHTTVLRAVIADVRFPERIAAIFERYRPEIVFHAAAHKHVPLMESNPIEAVTNNILGTRNVVKASLAVDVERFVMISTDKAVNPTNVMGASKRAAELIVLRAALEHGKAYVATRFGNVLGSRGSVLLTFKQQIARGGPVTVTHPDVRRYFMTIPEAVQLVLQASVLGRGGEVFVLDMGEPVKIVDLARDLVELSGLRIGEDIEIEFVGLRPGEKLFEELFIEGEEYRRTGHEKIFIAGNASHFVPYQLEGTLELLEEATNRHDREIFIQLLKHLVPEYAPVAPKQNTQGSGG